ncbi:MAG TPA: K(+)-transporting ATPase subunit C [Acidimicrobiales bacterium]
MRRQLLTGLRMTVVLTILLGLVYPLVMTGAGQVLFPKQANGSLVKDAQGKVVGSSLLGQSFTDAKGDPVARYFQPRPSAAGDGYDPTSSGASNLGPSNPKLLSAVAQRVVAYRALNRLSASTKVPVDAVTASGSGLDPDISVANALLQAPRVAKARNLPLTDVVKLIHSHIRERAWGFLGERTVNVLDLNLALDKR